MSTRSTSAERWRGVAWIVISATGFGAMAIFAKIAYREEVSLTSMLFLRFTLAGLLLAAWGTWQGMRWPRGKDLLWVAAMGGLGYVGQAYCYFSALKYASAGLVGLLLYLYPAIVTVLSAMIFRRSIGAARGWAVAIALAGTALTVGGDLQSQPLGIMLGIGAALIYSIYIVAGEGVMPRVGALPAATVVMLAAAVVLRRRGDSRGAGLACITRSLARRSGDRDLFDPAGHPRLFQGTGKARCLGCLDAVDARTTGDHRPRDAGAR